MNNLASVPWQGLDTRPYTPGMFGGGEARHGPIIANTPATGSLWNQPGPRPPNFYPGDLIPSMKLPPKPERGFLASPVIPSPGPAPIVPSSDRDISWGAPEGPYRQPLEIARGWAQPSLAAPTAPTLGAAPGSVDFGTAASPFAWQATDPTLTGQLGAGSYGSQPIVQPGQDPLSAAIDRAAFAPQQQVGTPGLGSYYASDQTQPQKRKPTGQ